MERNESNEFDEPWRKMPWGRHQVLEEKLRNLKIKNPAVKHVRILVVGEIGAGKSSFINSVNNAFQHRITSISLVAALSGVSLPKVYETYYIEGEDGSPLPFVVSITTGIVSGEGHGVNPNDIINALKGFVHEGYKFNPGSPLSEQSHYYRGNPELQDQTHCLVFIVDSSRLRFMHERTFNKIHLIRRAASELEIPQVVVMTQVDDACPLVKSNLQNIYRSKEIKELMQECSSAVGIPMNHIFPVKNYHEEIDPDDDIDLLILKAVDQIVNIGNDALKFKRNASSE